MPTRWQRISAFAFLGAFGRTVLTVIFTGLEVRSPSARRSPDVHRVTLAPTEPRTVNLLFTSRTAFEAVRFTVALPAGIEINGRAGVRCIAWNAALVAGDNVLPLDLVARALRAIGLYLEEAAAGGDVRRAGVDHRSAVAAKLGLCLRCGAGSQERERADPGDAHGAVHGSDVGFNSLMHRWRGRSRSCSSSCAGRSLECC